jgi:hypothetical protein
MAINVNTVYQTVLLILNKEQRGYMTPLEFNKTAGQAQLEIFETYFDSLNQQIRVPQTNADYSDRVVSIDEKISIFKEFDNATFISAGNFFGLPGIYTSTPGLTFSTQEFTVPANTPTTYTLTGNAFTLANQPSEIELFLNGVQLASNAYSIASGVITLVATPASGDKLIANVYSKQFYKLGQVLYNAGAPLPIEEIQRVERGELYHLITSDLTMPTTTNPICLYEKNQLSVYPQTIQAGIQVAYIRKPIAPIWGFDGGTNAAYSYSSSKSFNFELNQSEQTELITRILLYAGVVIQSQEIIQVAAAQIQQENTNQKS